MRESMDRRGFLRSVLAASAGPFLFQNSATFEQEASRSEEHPGGFETVGLYASLPTDPPPKDPRVYDSYKACGYTYLEFCEAGFRSRPDLLPEYYNNMSSAITLAHDKGFRVGIVLLAGMEQWTGPDGTLGANFPGVFSPRDKTKLTERFARLRDAVSSHLSGPTEEAFGKPSLPGMPAARRAEQIGSTEALIQLRPSFSAAVRSSPGCLGMWATVEGQSAKGA